MTRRSNPLRRWLDRLRQQLSKGLWSHPPTRIVCLLVGAAAGIAFATAGASQAAPSGCDTGAITAVIYRGESLRAFSLVYGDSVSDVIFQTWHCNVREPMTELDRIVDLGRWRKPFWHKMTLWYMPAGGGPLP